MISANVVINYGDAEAHAAFVRDLDGRLELLGDGHDPRDESTDLDFDSDSINDVHVALVYLKRAHPRVLLEIRQVA